MAVSKRVRYEILRRDNNQCRYCGATAAQAPLTIDHVMPVALGGADDPSNLVTACRDCNAGKTSTTPDAPLVADVDARAVQWARAMQTVANERAADREEMEKICEYLYSHWQGMRPHQWASADVPEDFEESIRTFVQAGLTHHDITELIDVTMRARTVKDKWKYFCGCCWTQIRQGRQRASEILAVEQVMEPVAPAQAIEILEVAGYDAPMLWVVVARAWTLAGFGELPFCACVRGSDVYCNDSACMLKLVVISSRKLAEHWRYSACDLDELEPVHGA